MFFKKFLVNLVLAVCILDRIIARLSLKKAMQHFQRFLSCNPQLTKLALYTINCFRFGLIFSGHYHLQLFKKFTLFTDLDFVAHFQISIHEGRSVLAARAEICENATFAVVC